MIKKKKKKVSAIVALKSGEFVPSPQFIIIVIIIIILFIIQGTRRGWGRGVLSTMVPKVRRKGPCSPAIFREICSVILGPRKIPYGNHCMNKHPDE